MDRDAPPECLSSLWYLCHSSNESPEGTDLEREVTMETRLIYMTAGSAEEGKNIAKTLVSEKLVACVNMLENMQSIYRWQGAIEEEQEVILIAKTKETLVPQVVERVTSIHSYDCPCIVSLPIVDGNPPFLKWILEETQ